MLVLYLTLWLALCLRNSQQTGHHLSQSDSRNAFLDSTNLPEYGEQQITTPCETTETALTVDLSSIGSFKSESSSVNTLSQSKADSSSFVEPHISWSRWRNPPIPPTTLIQSTSPCETSTGLHSHTTSTPYSHSVPLYTPPNTNTKSSYPPSRSQPSSSWGPPPWSSLPTLSTPVPSTESTIYSSQTLPSPPSTSSRSGVPSTTLSTLIPSCLSPSTITLTSRYDHISYVTIYKTTFLTRTVFAPSNTIATTATTLLSTYTEFLTKYFTFLTTESIPGSVSTTTNTLPPSLVCQAGTTYISNFNYGNFTTTVVYCNRTESTSRTRHCQSFCPPTQPCTSATIVPTTCQTPGYPISTITTGQYCTPSRIPGSISTTTFPPVILPPETIYQTRTSTLILTSRSTIIQSYLSSCTPITVTPTTCPTFGTSSPCLPTTITPTTCPPNTCSPSTVTTSGICISSLGTDKSSGTSDTGVTTITMTPSSCSSGIMTSTLISTSFPSSCPPVINTSFITETFTRATCTPSISISTIIPSNCPTSSSCSPSTIFPTSCDSNISTSTITHSSCKSLSTCSPTTVFPGSCGPNISTSTVISTRYINNSSQTTCSPSTVYPSSCQPTSRSFTSVHTTTISITPSSCPITIPICTTQTRSTSATSGSTCTFCAPPQTQSPSNSPTPPPVRCHRERTYLALLIVFLILFIIFFILFLLTLWRWWSIRRHCKCGVCSLLAYECTCQGGPTLGNAAGGVGTAVTGAGYVGSQPPAGDGFRNAGQPVEEGYGNSGQTTGDAGGGNEDIPVYGGSPGAIENAEAGNYGRAH